MNLEVRGGGFTPLRVFLPLPCVLREIYFFVPVFTPDVTLLCRPYSSRRRRRRKFRCRQRQLGVLVPLVTTKCSRENSDGTPVRLTCFPPQCSDCIKARKTFHVQLWLLENSECSLGRQKILCLKSKPLSQRNTCATVKHEVGIIFFKTPWKGTVELTHFSVFTNNTPICCLCQLNKFQHVNRAISPCHSHL